MNISTQDKAELEKLHKKKLACDIVSKATDTKINAILSKQYHGRNIILCRAKAPAEPAPKNFIERQQQKTNFMFCTNLDNFMENGNGYCLKADKSLHNIFSLAKNLIEYFDKENINGMTAHAIAELVSRRLRWTSVEIYGTENFRDSMIKILINFKVKILEPAKDITDAEPADDTTKKASVNKMKSAGIRR